MQLRIYSLSLLLRLGWGLIVSSEDLTLNLLVHGSQGPHILSDPEALTGPIQNP